jgi:ABC-type dipeptide/oligopeptide/nickel transport system permease subunit/formate hydrogenlyase subunit 3/multisubunit Na+/H+ antiporter MnhD subunit
MELILLLAIAAFGATASGVGLARGGRAGRIGAVLGGLSLLGVVAVSFALTAPRVGAGEIPPGIGILDGRLIPNNYMRLVIALWALDGALIVVVAWLAAGLAGLRGLMPAVLASIAGGSVALAATNLVLGAAAAGATGLVALVVLLAFRDPGGIPTAARELRVTMLATVLLMTAIVVAPLAGGLAVRGATGGGPGPVAGPTGSDGAPALVGLVVLAVALAVAARIGVIPFHLRVPQLTDVAPPIALPLLLAWVPLPLAVVGLATVDLLVAPLALPLNGEQLIIVAVVLVTLVGASLAAILQDDIRHAVGYLVIADGAFVLLGLAALTPDAWGPARTWLVTLAATKTAVATWAAVVESRFGSHHLPDLRGWIRRSPLLGASLLVATVATVLSVLIGVVLGLVAGFSRGWLDRSIMFVTDLFLSFPFILGALAMSPIIVQHFQKNLSLLSRVQLFSLIGILVIFGWMGLTRLIRGQVLSLREREFVQAAQVMGVPTSRILFKELLPNLIAPIVVATSLSLPAYVTLEAGLSYLGIGLTGIPSLGQTINDAQDYWSLYPLYLWAPVLTITILVLALNLLGDSVRDAFDPRTRR